MVTEVVVVVVLSRPEGVAGGGVEWSGGASRQIAVMLVTLVVMALFQGTKRGGVPIFSEAMMGGEEGSGVVVRVAGAKLGKLRKKSNTNWSRKRREKEKNRWYCITRVTQGQRTDPRDGLYGNKTLFLRAAWTVNSKAPSAHRRPGGCEKRS